MFGLSYLSNDRKRQLRKLQERLTNATDHQVRNETNLLIQDVMNEAKSFLKCDIYEASELRNQLLDQMATLAGLGKSTESFQMYLKELEFHIQTMQMAEAIKEKTRLKPDEGPNLREHSTSIHDLQKEKRKQAVKGRTRWVIGMEDEGEDNK